MRVVRGTMPCFVTWTESPYCALGHGQSHYAMLWNDVLLEVSSPQKEQHLTSYQEMEATR